MEFPSVGFNCSFEGCKQLGKPIWLDYRLYQFCLDHRYPTSHHCERWKENEKNVQFCETCSSMILKPEGKSSEDALKEHSQSNCTLHLLSSVYSTTKKKCFITECRNVSEGGVKVYVICDGHRHPPAHQCASLNIAFEEKAKRRMMAEEMISRYIKKSSSDKFKSDEIVSSSSKSTTITNKPKKKNKMIEMMKLKSKAQGDSSIPANSRIYLSVDFPSDSKVPNKPMFFNKEWTVGKSLDKIATTGKINNINNKLTSDDPERLILVNKETKNILQTDRKLGEVIENGDNISIEKFGLINK
ncbi:9910_t:CDS:2 [Funneliformis caledonium]|uniref:9910_t:CDS:1 n=1 Tax=Funneliformis caledonium TaxID=1117310 RepID=A0A9N9FIK9_9GLOM|nr:9910_t:CDS:2 [Funneliformis caledonium]